MEELVIPIGMPASAKVLEEGAYHLVVSAPGYQSEERDTFITAGSVTEERFELKPDADSLKKVVVIAVAILLMLLALYYAVRRRS